MKDFSFDNPDTQKRLDALEKFIMSWEGPRSQEYGATDQQLNNLKIPVPLQRLYKFCYNWPRANSMHSGIPLLSVQNVMYQKKEGDTSYYEIPEGLSIFASENQGVTCWATLETGEDPPVYGLDYEFGESYCSPDGQKHIRWTEISSSLTDFLIGFSLMELCFAGRIKRTNELIEFIKKRKDSMTKLVEYALGDLWSVYLLDGNILVLLRDWENLNSWIVGVRDNDALVRLQKHLKIGSGD